MRVVIAARHGGPEVLEIQDRPTPTPGSGEVLVDVRAAGVNFTDVYTRTGVYGSEMPTVMGQEGAGVVAAVGPDVTDLAVGDRVAWTSAPGSYADQVVVQAAAAVPVPAGLGDDVAAGALLQGMTAHYLLNSTYAVEPGDTILVHAAAGGVGLLLVQMAKAKGARVIATVSTDGKERLAREAGADEVLRYEGFAERVRALTGGEGVPVVYDSVGAATFDGSLASVRTRGLLVMFGQSSGVVPPFELRRLMNSGSLYLTRPTLGHYIATTEELRERASAVFGGILDGSLSLRIGGRYALTDAADAHRDLEGRRTTGKLLLIP
ncbi:MAG TPA: quinone oxidoreductase [Actinomycetes bacterium]|nr:quinone oxidoreductase [Actinomycetes bacterium]